MLARIVLTALAVAATPLAANAADPVLLYAAGSLRGALTEVGTVFQEATGIPVQSKYGPSGLLKDEIAGGAKAEVLASANMEQPRALAQANLAGPVVLFARNRLCALVRPGLSVTPATLLERMLDAQVKLGTSTPRANPSRDYAWEVFRKAEKIAPGSSAALDKKALQLTGGPSSPPPPAGRSVYGALVAEGKADIVLTYCTGALVARTENAGQQIVALPAELAVGADYGLTVIADAPPNAYRLAMFILGEAGQKILARHGFSAPTLPE